MLASGLAARCDVVISGQLPPLHPAPVVDDRQGPVGRVGAQADERRTRVERVGNDFGQDCFFERTGIGIAKVFKQMLEIDPGFTHGRILSLPALSRADRVPALVLSSPLNAGPQENHDAANHRRDARPDADRDRRARQPTSAPPPNILVIIADDWAYPHAGAYADTVVRTPTFDRIAHEGVLFRQVRGRTIVHAVAGVAAHRARASPIGGGRQPVEHAAFTIHGLSGPARTRRHTRSDTRGRVGARQLETGGRKRNPAGPQFATFDAFYAQAPKDKPFCFWFGSTDPHRPHDRDPARRRGSNPSRSGARASLPDTPQVRNDLLDYYFEIERLDREAGAILRTLEQAGQLDNTLVVFTSDNGMPFPRAKANLYDGGSHVPLAIRLPGRVKAGQQREDFVVLTDIAPTILKLPA